MFEVGENADGILAGVLFLVWLPAAVQITRLAWLPTERALGRTARAVRRLLIAATVFLVLKVIAIGLMWAVDWIFADNRVIVQMPLMLIPMGFTLAWSWPRLRPLVRLGSGDSGSATAPDHDLRAAAADPRLVVPVQATAVATVMGVAFAYVTRPVPPYVDDLLTHGLPIVAATVVLWAWQLVRLRRVTAATYARRSRAVRTSRAVVQLAVVIGVLVAGTAYVQAGTRLPGRMPMMSHGNIDTGGGAPISHHGDSASLSVDELKGPATGTPAHKFTLTAQQRPVRLTSGAIVDAYTYNGQSPGPELRVRQGELVEVVLRNEMAGENVTLHWHGINVPNGEDGVAGATQDAVRPGESYTYRFVPDVAGTYWYHTHNNPLEAVRRGLFGAIIVDPATGPPPGEKDVVVLAHEWRPDGTVDNQRIAFGVADTLQRQEIAPGTKVRVRLVNTDNNPAGDSRARVLTVGGAPVRVAAIDGVDLIGPTELTDPRLSLATGGRYDVTFTMPAGPVRITDLSAPEAGLVLAPPGDTSTPGVKDDGPAFDPLTYGGPGTRPFDAGSRYDREFTQLLDDRLGLFDGRMHFLPIINGESYPNMPMLMVREGDLVKVRIVNRSHQNHPMHLHGHHALVLSRDGKPATGSPWWVDSLDVIPGQIFEIAFRADNPGLWMDHCHNLDHAANGMVMHLAYENVTSPYEVGRDTPNRPE